MLPCNNVLVAIAPVSHVRAMPPCNSVLVAIAPVSHVRAMPSCNSVLVATIILRIRADHDQRLPIVKDQEVPVNRHPRNALDTLLNALQADRVVLPHNKEADILSIRDQAVVVPVVGPQRLVAPARRGNRDVPAAETVLEDALPVQHRNQVNDDQHRSSKRSQRVLSLFLHRSW